MGSNVSACASTGVIVLSSNLPQFITASSFGAGGVITSGCGVFSQYIVPLIIYQLLSIQGEVFNFRLTFSNGTISSTGTTVLTIDVELNATIGRAMVKFSNISSGLSGVDYTINKTSASGGGGLIPGGSAGGSPTITPLTYINFSVVFNQRIAGFNNLIDDSYNFSIPGNNNDPFNIEQNKLTVVYIAKKTVNLLF